MSIPDRLILSYLSMVTDCEQSRIDEIKRALEAGENPMQFKKELGRRIIAMYYDEPTAAEAEAEFERVFAEKGLPDEIPEKTFEWDESRIWLPKALVASGIQPSSGAARRMIKQGGVYLDGERVTDENLEIDVEREYLVKMGKRKFYKMIGHRK
jgi:tyrosyl-tRNA synthetase